MTPLSCCAPALPGATFEAKTHLGTGQRGLEAVPGSTFQPAS